MHFKTKLIAMKKSITFKGLCLAIAFTVAGFVAQAQLTNSFYLNGAFPIGEFGKKTEGASNIFGLLFKENIGHNAVAGLGFGYRASYRFDVGVGNVDGFLSGDIFWNRIDGDIRDNIIENNGKPTQYINIPLLLGVQYSYAVNETLRPFAEFGIGYDVMFVGKEGWKSAPDEDYTLKYKVGGAIAFQAGAGCYFGEHVSAGVNFYGLGKHAIKYKTNENSNALDPINKNVQRKINVLALRIGFHF